MKKINHDELSTYQRRAGYNGDLVAVSFLPGGLTNSSVLVGVFLTATDQLTAIKTINRGGELPTDTGQIYHKVISQGEGALDYVQRLAGDIKPEVNTTLFYNAGGTPVAWFQPIAQGATAGGAGPATSDKPD